MKLIKKTREKVPLDLEVAALADNDSESMKLKRIKKLDSATLFAGASEIMISHQDDQYILRLTKQNKLILTK